MDQVWIIGASRGLGRALAREFSARGMAVVGMAREAPADDGDFTAFERVDITDQSAFEAMVGRLLRARGAPRLIVHCAAYVAQGSLFDIGADAFRTELEANYLSFVRLCQHVAAGKSEGARTSIVAVGSTLGYVGCASLNNYSASKAALISFARSSRPELARRGIRIQIISPPHMSNAADLRGPQPFTVEWAARRFADAALAGTTERLLGASNRLLLLIARLSPRTAQTIMDRIGLDALHRRAVRPASA